MLKNNRASRVCWSGPCGGSGSFLCVRAFPLSRLWEWIMCQSGLQVARRAAAPQRRCRARPGQAGFKCLRGSNGAELSSLPPRRRTLQRAPYHAACSIILPPLLPPPPSPLPLPLLRPDSFAPHRAALFRGPHSPSTTTCCQSCLLGAVIHSWTL